MAAKTSNGTGGGNASAGASWVDGVAPADGDTITIACGDTITQDVNRIYGSNSGAVGHAVTLNGASSSSFGTFQVANGVTLTLRGFDTTSNTLMLINRYGTFAPQAGAAILGDVASNYGSMIINNGLINAQGSSGSHITFSVPSANVNWNTTLVSGETIGAGTYKYDVPNSISIAQFSNPWLSNNQTTGTAQGAMANQNSGTGGGSGSAVTFGGTNASAFSNPKTSIAAISATGDYFIDFDGGYVYFYWSYPSGQPSFTKTYKHLDQSSANWRGWGINSTANTTYNEAKFNYCDFQFMGSAAAADSRVLEADNKKSDTVSSSTHRNFVLTNCSFTNCYKLVGLKGCTGTAADPILIQGNTFNFAQGDNTYGYALMAYRSNNSFVKVDSNTGRSVYFINTASDGVNTFTQTNWAITNNTITAIQGFLISGGGSRCAFPGTLVSGNTITGTGYAVDARMFQDAGGQSGASNQLTITGNLLLTGKRGIHIASYLIVTDNLFYQLNHHTITGGTGDDTQLTNIRIINNLMYCGAVEGTTDASPYIELGYNHRQWLDDIQVVNNTCIGNKYGIVGFGDCQDANTYETLSRIVVANNLAMMNTSTGTKAWQRVALSTTSVCRPHVLQWDYNLDYNFATRYTNLTQQGTFTKGGTNYNAQTFGTRNVSGVALFDPSFSSKSGGSLTFVYTSATSQTLAWGAGSAVQLVLDSGTASSGAVNTLTDSTKSWTTTKNNSSCPINHYVKITGGTGAGQIRVITNNTATVLTVAPVWTTNPDATSTYVTLMAEVPLVDGAETVHAGIYWPDMQTSSQSDSGISFADHSVTGSSPLFSSSTGTTAASYRFSSSSPAKDAGTADNAPSFDYFSSSRPQGSAYDIGFYEISAGGFSPVSSGLIDGGLIL